MRLISDAQKILLIFICKNSWKTLHRFLALCDALLHIKYFKICGCNVSQSLKQSINFLLGFFFLLTNKDNNVA